MKKTIAATLAVAMLAVSAASPAMADRKTRNTFYILGGVLGGLLLSDSLNNKSHARPHQPRPIYRQPQPIYEQRCYRDWRGYYNPKGYFVRVPVKVCKWVRVQ